MNRFRLYIVTALAALTTFGAAAQSQPLKKFAVKATADIGLGGALSTKSSLAGMTTKSSGSGFGVDFGYTFWTKERQALEANIGLGYTSCSLTADVESLDYHYSAPAAADMDNVPYIRYYELSGLHQKASAGRVTVPIYINYKYRVHELVDAHVLAGFKLGFSGGGKVSDTSGSAFSYGIYPQYDDLMIDATYMNEFGQSSLSSMQVLKPQVSGMSASFLIGLGAEVRVNGPVSIDVSFRYEGGGNMFKSVGGSTTSFTADNAPVRYTVAEGQTVSPLCGYLTSSKISRLSLALGVIYRF